MSVALWNAQPVFISAYTLADALLLKNNIGYTFISHYGDLESPSGLYITVTPVSSKEPTNKI